MVKKKKCKSSVKPLPHWLHILHQKIMYVFYIQSMIKSNNLMRKLTWKLCKKINYLFMHITLAKKDAFWSAFGREN